jgi:ABC-type sugar transport system substrate-binding protein
VKKFFTTALVVSMMLIFGSMVIAQANTHKKPANKLKIGIVMDQATTQVISVMGNHMVAKAKAMGAQATLVFFDMNVATEIQQIENFISAGYDAILTEPLNSNDAIEAMQKAHDAGMAVVTFDTVPNCDYDFSFTASNSQLGYKIGEAAAKWAKTNLVAKGIEPVIGILDYPESEFLTQRADGIRKALTELLPTGKIVISAAGTTETKGLEAGENFLTAYPKMNVVCTINDDSAAGVYQAFSAAGYGNAKDRGLFSCDGTKTSLQNVAKGGFHKVCVDLSLPMVGESMTEAAIQYLSGAKVAYKKDNLFPMKPVDASNAKTALKVWD